MRVVWGGEKSRAGAFDKLLFGVEFGLGEEFSSVDGLVDFFLAVVVADVYLDRGETGVILGDFS